MSLIKRNGIKQIKKQRRKKDKSFSLNFRSHFLKTTFANCENKTVCECCHFVPVSLCQWHHEIEKGPNVWRKYQVHWSLASFFLCACSSLVKSKPTWLRFQFEARKYLLCVTTERTRKRSLKTEMLACFLPWSDFIRLICLAASIPSSPQFHSPSKSPTWLQPGTDLRRKARSDNDYANHVQTVQRHQQWRDNDRKHHPVRQLITPTITGGSRRKYHFHHR